MLITKLYGIIGHSVFIFNSFLNIYIYIFKLIERRNAAKELKQKVTAGWIRHPNTTPIVPSSTSIIIPPMMVYDNNIIVVFNASIGTRGLLKYYAVLRKQVGEKRVVRDCSSVESRRMDAAKNTFVFLGIACGYLWDFFLFLLPPF